MAAPASTARTVQLARGHNRAVRYAAMGAPTADLLPDPEEQRDTESGDD